MACEVCGSVRSSPASIYPTLDLSGLGFDTELGEIRQVSSREFASLCARIAAAIPEVADLLVPGTQLGRLSGTVSGTTPDVIWDLFWAPLFPAAAFEKSFTHMNLLAAREQFDIDGHREVFYELDIRTTARRLMPDGSDPNGVRCESCRKPVLIPSANFILDRSSVGDADVLRVTMNPNRSAMRRGTTGPSAMPFTSRSTAAESTGPRVNKSRSSLNRWWR